MSIIWCKQVYENWFIIYMYLTQQLKDRCTKTAEKSII